MKRQIEQVVHDRLRGSAIEGRLQRLEIRQAGRIEHHDFPVQPRALEIQSAQGAHQFRHLRRPVFAVAREKLDPVAFDSRQQAVAIELDFVAPGSGIGGQGFDQGRQLWSQGGGQGAGDRPGRHCELFRARVHAIGRSHHGRLGGRGYLLGGGPDRFCNHAVGQRLEHVVLPRLANEAVFFLDQQPGRLFFSLALHADQHPFALQFVTCKAELQIAVPVTGARVAHRFPRAAVPDDDLAGAILLGGDFAFEDVVGHRMVFYLDRHALDLRIQARAFGNRPALHGALEFEPEVVMQVAGPVFLNHE